MNNELINAIVSKSGIKLIQGLPTIPKYAVTIDQLAQITDISVSTTYRLMRALSKWSNVITSIEQTGHAPLSLYHVKSKSFTIRITKNRIEVTID